jgi:16S rRNA U1498 N3-methylase RsmE
MNVVVFSAEEWGRPLPANDERAVHIREVLRLQPGDRLRVGLLGAGVGQAEVLAGPEASAGAGAARNARGQANAPLLLAFPDPAALVGAEAPLPLTLVLGQPRPPVMQRLLKDLGALGLARILVVASDLSEKSYMQSRLWQGHPAPSGPTAGAESADAVTAAADGAWRRQLIAGAQQGGHCFLPAVERFYSIKKALEAADHPQSQRLVLDLVPDSVDLLGFCAGLAGRAGTAGAADQPGLVLAIGPERGWSERERGLFRVAGYGAFGLGRRILRTETACILACGMAALSLQVEPAADTADVEGPP